MIARSDLKIEIKNQLLKWKKEYELFQDLFSHTAGKNKELALIGDKVIDLILYKRLYSVVKTTELDIGDFKWEIEYRPFNKGLMDSKRQEYFSRNNQAKIFDELELAHMLITQHQIPSINVKHTVFEAIFGAIYLLLDMEETNNFLKKIAILMNYEELI